MPDIIEGQGGWLFHGQGANRWLDYFSGERRLAESTLHDWIDTLSRFDQEVKRRGARLSVWIAPEKHTVLHELLPSNISHGPKPLGDCLEYPLRTRGLAVLDNSHLIRQGATGQFHSKTDSHLNGKGAVHVCCSLLTSLGVQAQHAPGPYQIATVHAYGDLGRKVSPPRTSPIAAVCSAGQPAEVERKVQVSNVGSVTLTRCPSAPVLEKLLVFGNSFSSGDLLQLLASTFGEVLFIFSPAPDVPVLGEFNPRYVLFQTNERFISRGPSTLGGASFRAFGLVKLLASNSSRISQVHEIAARPQYSYATIAHSLFQAIASNQNAKAEELILEAAERISPFEACVFVALLQRLSAFQIGERLRQNLDDSLAAAHRAADYVLLSNALQKYRSAEGRIGALAQGDG